jgi:ribosomal protein S18 acetylase RimI-like enzyme
LFPTSPPPIAGYALSAGFRAEWEIVGHTQGWTSKLGVRAPWRGTGLAKALLAASMQAFAADRMQFAGLDVDSDNPSGAVGLYNALGYQVQHRAAHWTRDF